MTDPKQHHYVPKVYLENFADDDGKIWLYDKWKRTSFSSRPQSVLKENAYYAQPDHQKKIWNYEIEKFFSKEVEADWPKTVELIKNGPEKVSDLYNLYMWLYSLRVRVPNCRKSIEYMLQQQVRAAGPLIKDAKLAELEKKAIKQINLSLKKNYTTMDELYDDGVIHITIDPHKSIAAMADLAKGFSKVVLDLQLHFIKNCTTIDFNTNDNPIIHYPAGQTPENCTPYQFQAGRPFELIFPITKRYCLYHNSLNQIPAEGIRSTETNNIAFVKKINEFVGAFADRYVVSS